MWLQAAVRRLSDPQAVRLLNVGALQAALQTLTASRQLASYNKLQGTIVRNNLKQRAASANGNGNEHSSNPKGASDSSTLPQTSPADYRAGLP